MTRVKLQAQDASDLEVMAAHLQDAILRVGDFAWLPKTRRFAGLGTRFCWEAVDVAKGTPKKGKSFYRTLTGFHFDNVTSVRARGFDQGDVEAFLVVLELGFEPGEDEAGTVRLAFAGGAELALEVECLDAAMSDIAAPWQSDQLPKHPDEHGES